VSPDDLFLSSLTRISDLAEGPLEGALLAKGEWASGDYGVVEVLDPGGYPLLELTSGRMVELTRGDTLVGALGVRHATLEATGTWQAVGRDRGMDLLTAGGLLGKCTSRSTLVPSLPTVSYQGHVIRGDRKVTMGEFVDRAGPEAPFRLPTIMIVGSSMSAGKTTAARVLIRRLRAMGLDVLGAKVTGAGRYRDILAMHDAGARPVLDFVDVGLPSTVCPEEEYREALGLLLSRMARENADVAVVEAGASPLEPYNGDVAVDEFRDLVRMTVLCASDPYAVLGFSVALGTEPDLVTGPASNTLGGVELVQRLMDVPCLDVRDPNAAPELDGLLRNRLGLAGDDR
jgi:hypothetical protein